MHKAVRGQDEEMAQQLGTQAGIPRQLEKVIRSWFCSTCGEDWLNRWWIGELWRASVQIERVEIDLPKDRS